LTFFNHLRAHECRESTYGLGHNYILNMPPSKAGIITPNMAAAAAAFGVERHRRYGEGSSAPDAPSECELGRTGGRVAQGGELLLSLKAEAKFDRVFLSEDVINDGQLVANYTVDVSSDKKTWTNIVNGTAGGDTSSKPSAAADKGGMTIGTHHIDIVNATGKGKIHRVDPDFGSTLTVSNRDYQSNCWVNWKVMGQPCEFQVMRPGASCACGC
jgi:hypothetical protein